MNISRLVVRFRQFLTVWRYQGVREALARAQTVALRRMFVQLPGRRPSKWMPDGRLQIVTRFPPRPLTGKPTGDARFVVHWVIPDFAAGGGGHLTIFRCAYWLEYSGVENVFWIYNPSANHSENAAKQSAFQNYLPLRAKFRFLTSDISIAEGDAIVATDSWSVWPTLAAQRVNKRVYFVQDLESRFVAAGSHSAITEFSYQQGHHIVAAGHWLQKEMSRRGRETEAFQLAVDHDVFYPSNEVNGGVLGNSKPIKIAFYARQHTERRAVELGWASFLELKRRGINFVVHAFGQEVLPGMFPFEVISEGVLKPHELRSLYHNCDIGICFSVTNYSLVPQEMSAAGLPVVELYGESTVDVYPRNSVYLANPHPIDIARAVEELAQNPEKRLSIRETAISRVKSLEWKTEMLRLRPAFGVEKAKPQAPAVSIVIPTLNGGSRFEQVAASINGQDYPGEFEVIVVDSGSIDNTLDIAKHIRNVRVKSIKKEEFGHGRTRNYGVSLASGEFVALITQDAIPVGRNWLFNLVQGIEAFPNVAGAFGAHDAHKDSDEFVRRDIERHFDHIGRFPAVVDKRTPRGTRSELHWKQQLHYFSSNNCILRKEVWDSHQFRDVNYGEDQLWALDIVRAGFAKQYNTHARVRHSHDYEPDEVRKRARVEAAYFNLYFGYRIISPSFAASSLDSENAADRAFAEMNGIGTAALDKRLRQNSAKYEGWLEGLKDKRVMY